jgi:hypothetical protein
MHKNATKCNKTQSKWCVNKHGASKIIDTFETYQPARPPEEGQRGTGGTKGTLKAGRRARARGKEIAGIPLCGLSSRTYVVLQNHPRYIIPKTKTKKTATT